MFSRAPVGRREDRAATAVPVPLRISCLPTYVVVAAPGLSWNVGAVGHDDAAGHSPTMLGPVTAACASATMLPSCTMPAIDVELAGEGVGAVQDQRAAAGLGQVGRAGDLPAHRQLPDVHQERAGGVEVDRRRQTCWCPSGFPACRR